MRLTADELASYHRDGFLVREQAFDPAEIERMRVASEEVCREIERSAIERRKHRVSEFYIFQQDVAHETIVKWEPGDESIVQGLEPLAHLHHEFADLATHPAFVDPARDILGVDSVDLFTEKLNLKRAEVGGTYALHQDYPYWIASAAQPGNMVTVWVGLDDANASNGALEVLPGSHLHGEVMVHRKGSAMEQAEIDPDRFDTSALRTVEVPAGAAIYFGPFLVHRSGANTTSVDRRALLYTYQVAGHPHTRDELREWFAATKD